MLYRCRRHRIQEDETLIIPVAIELKQIPFPSFALLFLLLCLFI